MLWEYILDTIRNPSHILFTMFGRNNLCTTVPCFDSHTKKCVHKININQICSELNTDKQQHNSQVNERNKRERERENVSERWAGDRLAWLVWGCGRAYALEINCLTDSATQVWAPIPFNCMSLLRLSLSRISLIRTDIYITYTPNKLVCLAGVREPQFCYILSIISISLCDLLLLVLAVVLLEFEIFSLPFSIGVNI